LENQGAGGRIMYKRIYKTEDGGVEEWIDLPQDREKFWLVIFILIGLLAMQ
jgi:hypothetical protein